MAEKLNILVAIDETPSPVWDAIRPMANLIFVREGREAYRRLNTQPVELLFIDLHLMGMDSFQLLKRAREEHLCRWVVLTSEAPSFSFAQQGILYGVSAYLLRPLQEGEVEAQVRKALSNLPSSAAPWQGATEDVVRGLRQGTGLSAFLAAGNNLLTPETDVISAGVFWRDFYLEVLNQVYLRHSWLKSYHHPDEYAQPSVIEDGDPQLVLSYCKDGLGRLQDALGQLFPQVDDGLEEILTFLLENVHENLHQKTVAEKFYLTAPTLSVRFQKQLGISYREYLTRLKLQRAQYLLRYTNQSISALAARLGYKDREYFAKLFQQRTGQSLSQVRQVGWSDWHI
jgi:two-component system response regulator YesN